MYKPEVFVSFDYDYDKHYKFLLTAWNVNSRFKLVFSDATPNEINSLNISRIKAGLTSKIKDAFYTLVIVGKYANSPHKDRILIGHRNWINYEIYQSKIYGNKLIGVKLNRSYESPEELINSNASWALSFTEEAIINAINQAR